MLHRAIRGFLLAILVVLAVFLHGCGSDDDETVSTTEVTSYVCENGTALGAAPSGASAIDAWNGTGTSDDYANGIKAASVGACPISIVGLGGNDSAFIAHGHYWFPQVNTDQDVRESFFIQYYWGEKSIWRYDEIFVYDPAYDSKHGGAESFEASNQFNGVFTNVLFAPNTTGHHECIALPGQTFQSYADPSDATISEYIGVAVFPDGFMQTGTDFDAYMVTNRWPPPNAKVVYYVDRSAGSKNYGFVTAWLIFQDNSGVNYFWDFSDIIKSGDDAKSKFEAGPQYVFGFPEWWVDDCSCATSQYGIPCGSLGVNVTEYLR